ncbi:MAG: hypothetical protein FIA90_14040, partial [candidate division NC10 bacterium]|nr:hypothetical protein [candidate division NC10 bacterium]
PLKPLTPGITKTPPLTPRKADLVAFPPSSGSFCRSFGGKIKLQVNLKNQGLVAAPPRTTAVLFSTTSGTKTDTGLGDDFSDLLPGQAVSRIFEIPAGCFKPDCSFTVITDFENKVDEGKGETNNKVDGKCIG